MVLESVSNARDVLAKSWPMIVDECRAVLGGELHYQAVIYHCLRFHGAPKTQLGTNVKQWIDRPVSRLFQALDLRKHVDYQGGFEPVPDVVIFSPTVAGDWRRRNREATLRHMLLAIEVKASERANGRLSRREIVGDLEKLAAHQEEVRHRGGDMHPVMMVIDTAPDPAERMTAWTYSEAKQTAERYGVSFCYLSPDRAVGPVLQWDSGTIALHKPSHGRSSSAP